MNRTAWFSLAAVALALSGCGDGEDDPEAQPTATPTEMTTAVATEVSQPTEAPESKGQTYRIKRGDTLSAIAERFDTTVRALVRLNDIEDPHAIRAGQRIDIPAN